MFLVIVIQCNAFLHGHLIKKFIMKRHLHRVFARNGIHKSPFYPHTPVTVRIIQIVYQCLLLNLIFLISDIKCHVSEGQCFIIDLRCHFIQRLPVHKRPCIRHAIIISHEHHKHNCNQNNGYQMFWSHQKLLYQSADCGNRMTVHRTAVCNAGSC